MRTSRTRRAWSFLVPVVFLGAGLIATTSAQTARGTNLRSEGRGDLAGVIRDAQRRADRTADDVEALRAEIGGLTSRAGRGDTQVGALERQAAELAGAAGTVPVSGPGLTVTLDDASNPRPPEGFTRDDVVVHQQDLQAVVNALWAGGGEGMRLMDQRVISTSAVRCVGNVLILQDRVYSPPYRITAIGDPARLRAALDRSPQVRIYKEYVDVLGLGYDVAREKSVTLPAYDGPLELTNARPATEPGSDPTPSTSAATSSASPSAAGTSR